jgi:integrase
MKLTQKVVDALMLSPGETERVVWDEDVPGYGVRVRTAGAVFFFRYRFGARQPRVTIGSTRALTAQDARKIATKLYARVKLGEDPAGDRTDARARADETMGLAIKRYLIGQRATWRAGSFANVDRHLMKHARPLHRLELDKAADRRTIATLLNRVAATSGPVEANNAHASLSKFFGWAIGHGLLDGSNPLVGIPKAPTSGPRSHVPTDAEITKIWNALRPNDFGDAVRLLTLTACRRNEIGDLAWNEVDLAAGVIRLPAARTKNGQARAVPLSAPARPILQARQANGRARVFGAGQGGFSGWSRAKHDLDVRAGVAGWSLHDLRRYFSTTMNTEVIAAPHIVEACLGHAVGDRTTRTYNWTTYQEQVRVALELWGQRVMQLVSGELKSPAVVSLRRRKSAT